MRSNGYALAAVAAMAMAFGGFAAAYDGPVEKKVFTLPTYTTVGGTTIKDVKVGYETYGKLNASGDNAIFIPHFFSGNSHAAGKYKDTDAAFGYWDPIIGSGRPIDTDKYFVVSADALANLNTKDPNTTTTGPASINPATGKPYAMTFPVVTYVDSVRVHKALLDSLGVTKLQAAAGASGGSIQAMLWAAQYPDYVQRVVHVIGPGFSIHPYVIELVDEWILPIKLDPKWNNGDYYGRDEPVDGLAQGLKIVTISTRGFDWAEKTFGYKWAEPTKDPAAAIDNRFAIEDTLNKGGIARAKTVDANSMIYTVKANQLYNLGDDVKKIKAKILFVPAASDLVFPPELSKRAAERYRAQGGVAEVVIIEGDGGHLDGVFNVAKQGEAIRAFLAR
jgi:homoserine O-acetyltransferase